MLRRLPLDDPGGGEGPNDAAGVSKAAAMLEELSEESGEAEAKR
jgi:hypothetical protein